MLPYVNSWLRCINHSLLTKILQVSPSLSSISLYILSVMPTLPGFFFFWVIVSLILFFLKKNQCMVYGVCLWFFFSWNYFRVVLYLIFGLILHNCIFIVFSVWPFEVDLAFDPDNLDLSEEIISVINDLGFVLIMVWYNWTWGS